MVGRLVDKFSEREGVRGELMYRWTDLRTRQKAFEKEHSARLEALQAAKTTQAERAQQLAADLASKRAESTGFSEQKGGVEIKLAQLVAGDREFASFLPDMEKIAISNLQEKARVLGEQLRAAENESRAKAIGKRDFFTNQVRDKEQTIARFDKVVVTALRKQFSDDELNPLFRLLNPDLLEYPVAAGNIEVHRKGELTAALRGIVARFTGDVYQDENVTIAFRGSAAPVAKVANVEAVRDRLAEDQKSLQRWQEILTAIEQREVLEQELKTINQDLNGITDESGKVVKEGKIRRLFRFEEHQQAKAGEKMLQRELNTILESIRLAENRIKKLDEDRQTAETAAREAQNSIRTQENEFNVVMGEFNKCIFPNFSTKIRESDEAIPNDFGGAVALFLRQQEKEDQLSGAIHDLLGETERCFGEEFRGADEAETVRLLREELEALAEKEAALEKDWNAHIHTLRATFNQILQRLGDIHGARDDLNRHFGRVQVSDLKSVKMEVLEDTGLVSWIRRLAEYEPGGLFENDPQRESALVNFRKKLEVNSQVRYADLFTLGFTVVGADDRAHTYHDFRQIESHGTTVTIKVLFNLLLLKSQLKRDDCQVPFFLDEIQILDPANRHAILDTARKLGFIAITAAPEAVSEVDALYFLQPRKGMIVLRQKHRVGVKRQPIPA